MTRSLHRMHVVVAGCGPSGLAVAAACCQAGLDVLIVAPDLQQPWTNTYGVWHDELVNVGFERAIAHRWSRAEAWFGDEPIAIDRAYARIDGLRLRQELMERACGAELVEGRVTSYVERADHVAVELVDGREIQAEVFVDAMGAIAGTWAAAQTAWGVVCDATDVPWTTDAMCLMDWRAVDDSEEEPPSFLYAMPLGGDRWFFEETVLVGAPPVSPAHLAERLRCRLDRAGVRRGPALEEERCVIPMDAPLRPPRGRIVPVGASAGLVHPATGYSVGRGMRMAPRVARAAADLVASGASAVNDEMILPAYERRSDVLLRFGAGILRAWDANDIRIFFDAFFRIDAPLRDAYLSGDAPPSVLADAMRAVFGELPWRLRLRLARAGASRAPELLGALGDRDDRPRSEHVARS